MIGGQGDHRDHEQPGEVFGAAEAVGVAAGGGLVPSANAIHSGTAVSASEKLWMVSASKRDRTRRSATITSCASDGRTERQQADLHRADTGGAGFQRTVDAVGGVVAVRGEHLPQRRTEPAAAAVVAMTVTMVLWPWSCPWSMTVVVPVASVRVVGHARRPLCRPVGPDGGVGVQCSQIVGVAVMPWHAGAGVFGVEHRVGDQLPDVVVLQAVEDRGALAAGADQPRHPQLRQVLRHRRRRFPDVRRRGR